MKKWAILIIVVLLSGNVLWAFLFVKSGNQRKTKEQLQQEHLEAAEHFDSLKTSVPGTYSHRESYERPAEQLELLWGGDAHYIDPTGHRESAPLSWDLEPDGLVDVKGFAKFKVDTNGDLLKWGRERWKH